MGFKTFQLQWMGSYAISVVKSKDVGWCFWFWWISFWWSYINAISFKRCWRYVTYWGLETVQDFLIKLGFKPLMRLLEIGIFSLNNDLVRLTKIMNNLVKDLKILSFKVIFQCLKLVESFQKNNSVKNIWLGDQLILMKFSENFDF